MGAQDWLVWADRAYFGFAIIAAVATSLTIVAGLAQNRLNGRISDQKDRDLKTYQTTAGLQISAANREAADAKQTAAQAIQKAAELTAANLQLEAQIAPRHLPKIFSDSSLEDMSRFAGCTVSVGSYALDGEAAVFSKQIIDLLTALKLKVKDNRMSVMPLGDMSFGVTLSGPNMELAQTLLALLDEQNGPGLFSVPVTACGSGSSPDATIFVGVKPLPDIISPR